MSANEVTNNLLDKIIEAAQDAGKILLQADGCIDSVKSKEGHANYVTKYDSMVQKFLFERLHVVLPEAQFMGEEDGAEKFAESYRKGFCFVIDPIDGTTNFINGYRLSVVSIALLKDGLPYIGVVFNPYSDEMFWAQKGEGAFCNGKEIHSSEKPLEESLVLMGTAPYIPELHKKSFDIALYYFEKCADIRRSGSAEWDLCCVASGRAALYFEYSLGVWDYAAGGLILTEAGGKISDMDGNELTYDRKTSFLCVSKGLKDTDYLPKI